MVSGSTIEPIFRDETDTKTRNHKLETKLRLFSMDADSLQFSS